MLTQELKRSKYMKIKMQAVDFKADQKLVDFVQLKMDKLDQFYEKIIDGAVYLKLGSKNDIENKLVEITVNVPGDQLVVKKKSRSYEESTASAVDSLKRMLRKKNEKEHA